MRTNLLGFDNKKKRYEVEINFNSATPQKNIYFTLPPEIDPTSDIVKNGYIDALFLLSSLFAANQKVNLEFPYAVSPLLKSNIGIITGMLDINKTSLIKKAYHTIKTILQDKAPKLRKEIVKADNNKSGQFFTLGLDSFYTLLIGADKIDYILYIDGFDIQLSQSSTLEKVHGTINMIAEKTGKKALFFNTNLQEISNNIISWRSLHGAALASCAFFAADLLSTVYENSDNDLPVEEMMNWGTGTYINSYYSTEYMSVSSFGGEKNRIEKAHQLSKSPHFDLVLRYVKPCWGVNKKNSTEINCGNCEKCARTYLSLLAATGIIDIPAFANFNIRNLRKIAPCDTPGITDLWRLIYSHLEKRFGVDSEYTRETKNYINTFTV